MLHFPDRTAYVAQFIADAAAGRAWGKWQYYTFDALCSLPTGAAIREALIREPEQTEPLLLRLAEQGCLEPILNVLSPRDAQQVYAACGAISGTADPHTAPVFSAAPHRVTPAGNRQRRLIDALLSAWQNACLQSFPAGMATAHNALRLYIAFRNPASSSAADVHRTAMFTAINHLLGFADLLRQVATPDVLVTHIVAGDIRRAIELAQRYGVIAHLESLPFFAHIAAGDRDWLPRVVQTVSPTTAAREDTSRKTHRTAQIWATPCGGMFLLLPSLLDLHLSDLMASAPDPDLDDLPHAAALRYLLMLRCLGRPRMMEIAHDSALHLIAGLDEPPSRDALERFSASTTMATDHACLCGLIQRLARQGRIEGRYLSAERVATADFGQDVLLLRDITHDTWVYATTICDDAAVQAALHQGLTFVQEMVETPCEYLLLGAGLRPCLDDAMPADWEGHILSLEPEAIREVAPAQLTPYLTRAKPAAQELAYVSLLNLTPPLMANAHFDLTGSLMAHAVLKAFARRLMGFDASSAEYLYQNFLAGMSIVRIEGDQIDVQLPRSPLHVILRMAGVDGQTYHVPWLHDAQVTLSLLGDERKG